MLGLLTAILAVGDFPVSTTIDEQLALLDVVLPPFNNPNKVEVSEPVTDACNIDPRLGKEFPTTLLSLAGFTEVGRTGKLTIGDADEPCDDRWASRTVGLAFGAGGDGAVVDAVCRLQELIAIVGENAFHSGLANNRILVSGSSGGAFAYALFNSIDIVSPELKDGELSAEEVLNWPNTESGASEPFPEGTVPVTVVQIFNERLNGVLIGDSVAQVIAGVLQKTELASVLPSMSLTQLFSACQGGTFCDVLGAIAQLATSDNTSDLVAPVIDAAMEALAFTRQAIYAGPTGRLVFAAALGKVASCLTEETVAVCVLSQALTFLGLSADDLQPGKKPFYVGLSLQNHWDGARGDGRRDGGDGTLPEAGFDKAIAAAALKVQRGRIPRLVGTGAFDLGKGILGAPPIVYRTLSNATHPFIFDRAKPLDLPTGLAAAINFPARSLNMADRRAEGEVGTCPLQVGAAQAPEDCRELVPTRDFLAFQSQLFTARSEWQDSANGISTATYTDAGVLDPLGIIPLLRKRVGSIIAFNEINQLSYNLFLGQYFGVDLNTEDACPAAVEVLGLDNYAVFDPELWGQVFPALGLQGGSGSVVLRDVHVRANAFFGIEEHRLDYLIIVGNSKVNSFAGAFRNNEWEDTVSNAIGPRAVFDPTADEPLTFPFVPEAPESAPFANGLDRGCPFPFCSWPAQPFGLTTAQEGTLVCLLGKYKVRGVQASIRDALSPAVPRRYRSRA